MIIFRSVGARAGLVGNPSDGFGGKTIACLISDFRASVALWESPQLQIVPHPAYDPLVFRDLPDLAHTVGRGGYYGGLRLLFGTCRRFHAYCAEAGIHLPKRSFTVEYNTDIPRQVGLAGSSAIITAAFKSLMEFYELSDDDIPLPIQPTLILEVETKELGITAGLQDRVAQAYGGLVYMDFAPELFETQGHGAYEPLDIDLLPPLFLAYAPEPSFSGRIHAPIRMRWEQGDETVVQAMLTFAGYAQEARTALLERDHAALARLMNANFDLRLSLYGEAAIGERNLDMVRLARSLGLPATFPGSGGAIVGICGGDDDLAAARTAFAEHGCELLRIHPAETISTGGQDFYDYFDRQEHLRRQPERPGVGRRPRP
jgi:glucuronokinase